jgi:hypothetical protein
MQYKLLMGAQFLQRSKFSGWDQHPVHFWHCIYKHKITSNSLIIVLNCSC